MMHVKTFLFLFLILLNTTPIHAYEDDDLSYDEYADMDEEDEDDEELDLDEIVPSYQANKFKPYADKDVPDSNQAMVTLEAGPSAIVGGCVNAITGDFFDSHVSLTVPGLHPLSVQCTYCSSEKEWNFQYMPELQVGHSNGQNHLYARYLDDHGSGITYRGYVGDYAGGIKDGTLTIPPALFEKGLTNCGSGEISGKTNWRNSQILPNRYAKRVRKKQKKSSFDYVLQHGSGAKRYFLQYKGHKHKQKGALCGKFRLNRESHPNGNSVSYKYFCDKLSSVEVVSQANQSLANLSVSHKNDKFLHSMDWQSLNGSVSFTFEDKKEKRIKSILPTNAIPIIYNYDPESHELVKKILPDKRFLEIDYYGSGDGKGCVSSLKTPIGIAYTFTYLSGETQVFDAELNVTKYFYDKKTKRLKSIKRYDKLSPKCLSEEHVYWSDYGNTNGNLIARTFEGDGKTYFSHILTYDNFGNIKQDTLYGNLTGTSLPLLIPPCGYEPLSPCDAYVKTYEYSQDKKNLLLEENDGKKIITFEYYPDQLLKQRFTKSENKILKREFFKYKDGVLIEEIWDDGQSLKSDDLSYVTERHKKCIIPTSEFPVGLPEIVEEYYLSSSDQYLLLKKTINTYSLQGLLKQEDHYDSNGDLVFSLKWDYDKLGNVIEKTDAVGQTTIFDYDANCNKILEKGPRSGWRKEFRYDHNNRLYQEEEYWPDGTTLITTHGHNLLNQRIYTIDPHGNETIFTYDALGHLVKTEGPPLYVGPDEIIVPFEETEYDAMGNPIVQKDANGHITKASYTIRGKPHRIEHPDGSIEQKEYSLSGLLVKEIARNGLITTYTHDPFDRILITTLTDPITNEQKTKINTYSTFQLLTETDEEGMVTTYTYDKAGRRTSMKKGDHETKYEYDTLSRIVKTIEAHGRITHKTYDFLDRVREERIEDEHGEVFEKKQYTYDEDGNKDSTTLFTQADPSTTKTDFYPNKKPSCITDALGNQTLFFYDHAYSHRGQKVLKLTKIDPLGNQEVIIHDTHGNVCCQVQLDTFGQIVQGEVGFYDPLGHKTLSRISVYRGQEYKGFIDNRWEFDAMGQMCRSFEAVATPEQKIVRHHYNTFGQKEKIDMPNGISIINTYDIFGRLSTYHSTDNTIHYEYGYDKKDRPLLVKDLVHQTENKLDYDKYGCLISETLDNGLTLTYTYDQLDRPLTVTLPDKSVIRYRYNAHHLIAVERIKESQTAYTHHYDQYDLAGNIIEQTLLGHAGKIHYQYDLLQRPISIQAPHWQETIPLDGFDAINNLLTRNVTDKLGPVTYTYTYDRLNQLISENGFVSHTYQNDSLYNRMAKDDHPYEVNALNQLLSQTDCTYHYDRNGNLKKKISPHHETHYVYDALDRLIAVDQGSHTTTYTYDSFHRRLSKTHNGQTTHYLYHNQNEIGAFSSGKITQLRVLGVSYGAEIGGAVALELNDQTYAPIHDPQGNIVALLDNSGELVEGYRYSVFGETQTFAEVDNPWRYSSKRYDPETGFIYFGRRYYDPAIGRWTTPDPAGYADGPNLYAYVHNHPLAYIDPDGQLAFLLPFVVSLAIDLAVDFALPLAAAYAEPYIGATATSFLAGVVKGMNSDFTPGSVAETGGMSIGAILAYKKNAIKAVCKNGYAMAANLAQKEVVQAVSHTATKNIEKAVWHETKDQISHKTAHVADKYLGKTGAKLSKPTPNGKIAQLEEKVSQWLGKETKMIKNEAGDLVLLSQDQLRRVRFDFKRPYPHHNPHMHVDEKINRLLWKESGQIYPTDVPHF
jgi:RHS repeat-associated protein